MAFQPGNRRQSVFPPRASYYAVGALSGGAGSKTITVPRAFKGIGAIFAVLPPDTPAGVSVSGARLLPPATGSYADGNPPRVELTVTGSGATDVLLIEA